MASPLASLIGSSAKAAKCLVLSRARCGSISVGLDAIAGLERPGVLEELDDLIAAVARGVAFLCLGQVDGDQPRECPVPPPSQTLGLPQIAELLA